MASRLSALAALLLAGCVSDAPVVSYVPLEVKVPVAVRLDPPGFLTGPLSSGLPEFVSPDDPEATSALTPRGERALKSLLEEMRTRLDAWVRWSAEKP